MTKDEALAFDLALEALEETLKTLDDANAIPGGPIADTIWYSPYETLFDYLEVQIAAIKQARSAPMQEPVAWMFEDDEDNGHKTFMQTPPSPEVVAYLAKWNRPAWVPIYTIPPVAQRQWVGLTDEEIAAIYADSSPLTFIELAEAKLKEKNT
jgi:hypothetical protein